LHHVGLVLVAWVVACANEAKDDRTRAPEAAHGNDGAAALSNDGAAALSNDGGAGTPDATSLSAGCLVGTQMNCQCCTASGRCGVSIGGCVEVFPNAPVDRTCDTGGSGGPGNAIVLFSGCCLPSGICGALSPFGGCLDLRAVPTGPAASVPLRACNPHPTCSDGVMNADETEVDCGGHCGPCADESPYDATAPSMPDAGPDR
jgi:hypothetical protein